MHIDYEKDKREDTSHCIIADISIKEMPVDECPSHRPVVGSLSSEKSAK